jgi:hypothetical protein
VTTIAFLDILEVIYTENKIGTTYGDIRGLGLQNLRGFRGLGVANLAIAH